MEELISKISDIVSAEQERGSQLHWRINHSDHESYAVIREEYEECLEELSDCEKHLNEFWSCVRNDCTEPEKLWALRSLSKSCYMLIAEAIQLCGVAEKAINSICERGAV